MDAFVQYKLNIAMESTILLFLVILLITCFLEKRHFVTTRPLIFLISFIFLTLTNQIVIWCMLIQNIPLTYGATPMRFVYILDYIFTYSLSVAFYFYAETLVKDGYKKIGVAYRSVKHAQIAVVGWGVLSSLVYVIMIFIPSVYHVEEGVAVFSIPGYVAMHIMSKFACVCALYLIIHHRKVISKQEAYLSFVFITLSSVFIIIDELVGLCISYVLLALFTFILYVQIDIHKGLLLERQEREIVEARTQIMLSQIQPHFLYNVLTTISSMCEVQNALQARDVVNRFADYLRTNLESLGKEKIIPFEKELEHINTYLWLEKVRFEDAINIRYEIETIGFSVPSLAIQPIVENAVKHGIQEKEDGGTITIRTYETEQDFVISIEDDGVGFDVKDKRDTKLHVGIDNVRKRLEIISGGTCKIESEPGMGTIVTIRIPKSDEDN